MQSTIVSSSIGGGVVDVDVGGGGQVCPDVHEDGGVYLNAGIEIDSGRTLPHCRIQRNNR